MIILLLKRTVSFKFRLFRLLLNECIICDEEKGANFSEHFIGNSKDTSLRGLLTTMYRILRNNNKSIGSLCWLSPCIPVILGGIY